MVISKKLLFSKDSEGVQLFQGGELFRGGGGGGGGGGPNANFYRNPYNLWFSRGVRTPYPPLDPHTRFHSLFLLFQKETLAIHLSTKTNVWT